ncbi:MAG TPA: adenosylcobinamide-GDP ribazoletransferase [Bryobacteraceae bacterium]|nr:adenosylcobinamide-GDP ribazoletransferase [Bryobacteraceae bacterium]
MIRQFLLALGFLTRLPAGKLACTAEDIGRASRWFPLVGGLLGAIDIALLRLLGPFFPALLTAVLIVAADAFLTGAMHFDGLADTADGFGAGRTREDVLRIMRDHAIGSYGACALFLAITLKIAAIGAMIGSARAMPALLLAPALGRWSAVFSSALAGYARPAQDDLPRSVGSPARFIGRTELIVASALAIALALPLAPWRGAAALALALAAMAAWTRWCGGRIGGVTGDTLGAGIEITECLVLLAFSAGS